MAKQKPKPEEELEEVELGAKPAETPEDESLTEIPSSGIEVQEEEEVEEEVEAGEAEKGKDTSSQAILDGFNMLRDELRSRGETPPALPVKAEEETEEDFKARVNEELFKEDPYGILSKVTDRRTRKIIADEVIPILGSIMETAFGNEEFKLRNDEKDGPIFKKYEDEIRKTLKTLTPAQQKNPQVLRAVFDRVKSLHVEEIVEMRLEEREKERGRKVSSPGVSRKAVVAEGGSTVIPTNGKTRVMIPKSELERLKRVAAREGVPVEVLVERRGEIKF